MSEKDKERETLVAEQARRVAPVVWLLGKVQSGKSSIVRGLTRDADAQIGTGFTACTKTATVYDFPPDAPLIRFLDTRGLGESEYDPTQDLEIAEQSAHCIIAVMRAMDPQQNAVIDVLQRVRRRQRDWPILVAQTHLHEGYASGKSHVLPYPFQRCSAQENQSVSTGDVPADLLRALNYQRAAVRNLPGDDNIAFVPLDFTLKADNFDPQNYGLSALEMALAEIAPAALKAALQETLTVKNSGHHAMIVGHAAAASAVDLVPLAAIVGVPAVQANLLRKLAGVHGIAWSRRILFEFSAALGAGFAARYATSIGIRNLSKFIPIYGQTVGTAASAATSFATTFALGKAAVYFLTARKKGKVDSAGVQAAWADALKEAFILAKNRDLPQPNGNDE